MWGRLKPKKTINLLAGVEAEVARFGKLMVQVRTTTCAKAAHQGHMPDGTITSLCRRLRVREYAGSWTELLEIVSVDAPLI